MAENPFKALADATETFAKMTAVDESKSQEIKDRLAREASLQKVDLTIKAGSGTTGQHSQRQP